MRRLETDWLMGIDSCAWLPNHYLTELNVFNLYKKHCAVCFPLLKGAILKFLEVTQPLQGAPPGTHSVLGVVFSAYHKICHLKIALPEGCPNDICKGEKKKQLNTLEKGRAPSRGLPRMAASHLLFVIPSAFTTELFLGSDPVNWCLSAALSPLHVTCSKDKLWVFAPTSSQHVYCRYFCALCYTWPPNQCFIPAKSRF